ncbi:MAG: Flp family type IVb pilin [Acidobacteriia bacterium]|nr:Flp family type IVb pilin [Terriglobia bacterium]
MKTFFKGEEGQDVVEYTLLLAFVCLASAALFTGVGKDLNTIWLFANKTADNAVTALGGS